MAGHSQFKNIMYRKGAQDKKRAKIFTRLIKELAVAARSGTDPASNPRLRASDLLRHKRVVLLHIALQDLLQRSHHALEGLPIEGQALRRRHRGTDRRGSQRRQRATRGLVDLLHGSRVHGLADIDDRPRRGFRIVPGALFSLRHRHSGGRAPPVLQ